MSSFEVSLVNPLAGVAFPGNELLWGEPESDFVVGGLNGIRSVDDVSADIDAVVTTDGTGLRVEGLGGTKHFSSGKDGVVTFPNHSADGAGDHVFDESLEESLGGEIGVVLFHVFLSGLAELHGDELESFSFESLHNGTNESSLDTIGLDHNESSFFLGFDHLI